MSNQQLEQEVLQHFQVEELEQRYEMRPWAGGDLKEDDPEGDFHWEKIF